VLILDSRMLSKNYGRIFLRSLPDAQLVKGSGKDVFAGMAGFFNSQGGLHSQKQPVRK